MTGVQTCALPILGKPTGKEAVGKPTGKEAVGKPTGKEAVGKPTRKTPDMQNVRDITETVTEKRTMEEIPPNTWEQVPRRLSTERREVTGESSSRTGRVWQQEVTNESPTDHASDQENEEDEGNSSEVNCKDDQVEFIKEFQDFMNEAIERLLKKPARRHPRQKDKPEPCTEQGKRKEVLRKEAEMLPQINVSGDSDNEQNSRISLETMDIDRCVQKLVRTDQEGSECAQ